MRSARPLRSLRLVGSIAVQVGALLGFSLALAGRPPEVLEQERSEEALALDYLVRKSDALGTSLVERRAHLRKRLRAMYKMSQGGYVRLLLGADSATDLFARRNAAERILHRDVAELEAVREELGELDGLREKLRGSEHRAAQLLVEAREAQVAGVGEHPKFGRPVVGAVVRRFGPYHDDSGLEFSRDGIDLATRAGSLVYPPAAGAVRAVVDLPGIGPSVIIDHGELHGGGWISVVGNLKEVRVRLGARVVPQFALGTAAGAEVHLQLSQSGTWVDPLPFL